MIGWGIVFGYVLMGIGTARLIFTHQYTKHYPYWERKSKNRDSAYYREDPHYRTLRDPDIQFPMWLGGVFWPFGLVYMVLVRPLLHKGLPLFLRWFTGPARARVKAKAQEVKS